MGGMPINPVLSGLLNGYAVGNMLRRSAMEKDQYERAKLRQDWADQAEDASIQSRLLAAGRPVEGGTVAEQMLAPRIEGAPESLQSGPTTIYRKPDSSRMVKYKTRDGRQLEYELYTPDEQFSRRLKEASLLSDAKTMAAISQKKKLLDEFGVQLPSEVASKLGPGFQGKIDPTQLSSIDDVLRAMQPPKQLPLHPITSTNDNGDVVTDWHDPATGAIIATGHRPGAGRRTKEQPNAEAEKISDDRTINTLVSRVIEDTAKAGGSLDDAVKNAWVYYQGDPAFKSNRGKVIRALNALRQRPTEDKSLSGLVSQFKTSGKPSQTKSGSSPKRLTDVNVARQYLDRAGGDKSKARQLAAADGWNF
ncbi:MAG TPA: hypothetical protein PKJ41_03820 [Bryobacteraceae bacterium]|nr:hypothetical protein [Bryobacteraceae bacterium]HPT26935.1 hypothetical protein [Bryobacteraceae bacterium]